MFLKYFTVFKKSCNSYITIQKYLSSGKIANDAIKLSDSCVQKLKQLCEGDKSFLRLCVESGGCSGFQYKFHLDDKVGEDDRIFKRDGVRVVVDETSLEYIRGSTIDYHTELIRSAFRVVQNPNADVGCSCGASFSIKID
ncbi:iron-sulfur cluster assembly 2 homolog, mitochondrial [Papilio machaon]|uniref:iron-sulfur cluster assembly 2 homolog, mitochondrial n=1 Tax=Papilio machaon TaxID=76193 RepID=UPI0006EB08B4|nr:iron-sulfur cluster assembly 2 homolog, mitochondrial [Papilio machaon]